MVSRTPRLRVCHLWRSTESRTDLARTRSAGKTAIRQFVSVRCDLSRTRRKGESFGLAGQSLRESGKRLLVAKGGSDLRQYAQRAAFSRAGPKSFWLEPMKIDNFFAELKRRNVYKVAVAYAVAGWALAQGIAQVFPLFDVPNWALRLIVLTIVIGFPIALVIAWAFELTPEGLKRTEDVDRSGERVPKKHAWIYVVVIGAAISLALFFLGRYSAGSKTAPRQSKAATASSISDKSIAVLPFENLSEDKANAYFAEGIQEEILTRLAKIADLKVISRTSTQHYKSAPENLSEIAKQLGVANILEGSVQKAADQVRVNVQLIQAASDSHLWADTFDRKLTDIFGVESEVAKAIADALQAKLTGREQQALGSSQQTIQRRTTRTSGAWLLKRARPPLQTIQKGSSAFTSGRCSLTQLLRWHGPDFLVRTLRCTP